MPSKPATVEDYLASLPEDRREALEAVRKVLLKNLPKGYEEGIQYNMIGYYVPHSIYPSGYHCDPKQPVPFASIASQKNHMALYLFCIYSDPQGKEQFIREWKASGRKLDMGASCVRFKKLEDVPFDVLGAAIKRVPVKDFIAAYEASIPASKRKPASGKTATKKTAKTPSSKKQSTKKKVAKNAAKKQTTGKTPRQR